MKQIGLLLLVCIGMSHYCLAQKNNAIKLNYISPLFRTFNLSFEKTLKEDASLQVGACYIGLPDAGTIYTGFGITCEYRKYLNGEVFDGNYIAPFFRYGNITITQLFSSDKELMSVYSPGFVIGRQWVKRGVSFDIFVGPAFNAVAYRVVSGLHLHDNNPYFGGYGIRLGSTVGLPF